MALLTISTIARDGVKINVSCYTIKLDFDLDPRPLLKNKMVPIHLSANESRTARPAFYI